jgi:hypothetical protein
MLSACETVPPGEFYQYAFFRQEMGSKLSSAGFEVERIQPSGVIKTLTDHLPFVERFPFGRARTCVAYGLDTLPFVRNLEHTCIWVAGKKRLNI